MNDFAKLWLNSPLPLAGEGTGEGGGWFADAAHIPSRHRHPRPQNMRAELLVVHCISLPRGEYGGGDIVKLFCGELDCDSREEYKSLCGLRVSAHFLIRRGGEMLQFVSADECAWHAGESQWRGREQCNEFSVGAELEGTDDSAFTNEQYAALAHLSRALIWRNDNLAIAGHEHIAPGRKTDPGKCFDWQRLFADIGKKHDGRNNTAT